MAEYRRSEIVSGLFVVVTVVIFAMFAFRVQGMDLFAFARGDSVVCRAWFTDVKTLERGAKVSVAGRSVGVVREVRILSRPQDQAQVDRLRATDPEKFGRLEAGWLRQMIEVEFELDDAALRLHVATASVQLAQEGFLGRHYLALDPGYWPPGGEPEAIFAAGLQQPLSLATHEGGGLDELLAAARPILSRVDTLLARLQDGLLSEANIGRTGAALDDLATSLRAVRESLTDDNPEGVRRRVLVPLGDVLTQAGKLLEESRPEVDRLLETLVTTSSGLEPRLGRIETDLRALLTSASGMIDENRAELAETTRRLRRTVWQAEMAIRKIRANPAVILFGDDEADLEARPTDHTRLDASGRARPYGQRDEKDTGGK